MRKTIIALAASLALVSGSAFATGSIVTHNDASNGGGLIQGSSASAGSISGATTVGTGFAGTYGIANMNATSSGQVVSYPSYAGVAGTTSVTGHTESGTLVEGAGMAGSLAGGDAKAGVLGGASFSEGTHQHYQRCYGRHCYTSPRFNEQTVQAGEAGIVAASKGSAWSASGSIGDGEGLAVNGFSAHGDASAFADVDRNNRYNYDTESDVQTSSHATAYTLETGNAIGNTKALGLGLGHADAWRIHD